MRSVPASSETVWPNAAIGSRTNNSNDQDRPNWNFMRCTELSFLNIACLLREGSEAAVSVDNPIPGYLSVNANLAGMVLIKLRDQPPGLPAQRAEERFLESRASARGRRGGPYSRVGWFFPGEEA